MRSRDWWWLRTRIEGLLSAPAQLVVVGAKLVWVQQTRIGLAWSPPFNDLD